VVSKTRPLLEKADNNTVKKRRRRKKKKKKKKKKRRMGKFVELQLTPTLAIRCFIPFVGKDKYATTHAMATVCTDKYKYVSVWCKTP